MGNSLHFRVDADATVGAGHLMRCLALARAAIAAGMRARFHSRIASRALAQQVIDAGCELAPQLDIDAGEGWIVVDGYGFDSAYLEQLAGGRARVAVIDDLAALPRYPVDLVLNQNIDAEGGRYRAKPGCRLLMGTSYALLRPEFAAYAAWRRPALDEARKLLVTLGGGDSAAAGARVLEALAGTKPGLEVRVLAGAERGDAMLAGAALGARGAGHRVSLEAHATDMPEQMAWADFAVAAGGSTVWELAFMQVPSVLMTLADNQRANVAGLVREGCALAWDGAAAIDALRADGARRAAMASRGRTLVDGRGAARVVEALLS